MARSIYFAAAAWLALSTLASSALAADDKLALANGAWTPSAANAAAAQAALKTYVDVDAPPSLWADNTPESPGEARLRHGLSPKLAQYWIRATGVMGRQDELVAKIDGKRVIRLDGFCKVSGDTWKEPHFTVNDGGGDCYFHAEYEPETKTIVFFEVNR